MARSSPKSNHPGDAAVGLTRYALLCALSELSPESSSSLNLSLKKVSDLINQYDENATAINVRMRLLLEISYYATLAHASSLAAMCKQEFECFKSSALDKSEQVWPYLVAYRCDGWEDISFDKPANYKISHDTVSTLSSSKVVGKTSGIANDVQTKLTALTDLLKNHSEKYGEDSFNYLLLESMNNYSVAKEILTQLVEQSTQIKEKYYAQHWQLIQAVAEWASLAEVYFKGLNSEKCEALRRSSCGRKDSENAEKDAPQFIQVLQQQPEFQQNLSLLDDIYTVERLLNDFSEYDDGAWYLHMTSILAQQLQKYIMDNQILNSYMLDYVSYLFLVLEDMLLINHGLSHQEVCALNELWQKKLHERIVTFLGRNMTPTQLLDEHYQQSIKALIYVEKKICLLGKLPEGSSQNSNDVFSRQLVKFNFSQEAKVSISIAELRKHQTWLSQIKQGLQEVSQGRMNGGGPQGVQSFLSAAIPGVKIQRLGGISPKVYRVSGRDNSWLLLRLFDMPIEESNQQAIKLLEEGAADFLGKNYYRSEGFGEYSYCECSEFFAAGSLDKYIINLDHSPKGGMTEKQQRLLFQHFKQVLTVMAYLHSNNAYFPDAKPSNFLFDKDPLQHDDAKLVLSDLKSLWMFSEESHQRGRDVIACTPDYRAPEILTSADDIHPFAQDYHALGMTFLEYLTGTVDKNLIEAFQPRDHFELVLKRVLQRLIVVEPQQRVAYGDFLVENFELLEKRLFAPLPDRDSLQRLSANFGATLFTRHHFMRTGSDKVLQGQRIRAYKMAVHTQIRRLYPESNRGSVFEMN